MRKIFTLLFLLGVLAASAQNPLIIKTVSSTTLEPESDAQLTKRVKPWNGKLFYNGKGASGHTILATTDGTPAGTVQVSDLGDVGSIDGVYPAQDFVYITTLKSTIVSYPPLVVSWERKLWRTDGTSGGTTLLKSFPATNSATLTGVYYSDALSSVNYGIQGNTIFFSGYDATNGLELWKSDGTVAGTALVKDIHAGTANSGPMGFCRVGGVVCFFAADSPLDYQLWKTDGTASGTSIVTRINPSASSIAEFSAGLYKGRMYFYANDGTTGAEVWSTDGTAAGTRLLKETIAGNNAATGTGGFRTDLAFIQDDRYLYFPVERSKYVWRTDGTATGTIQLNSTALTSQTIAGATARGNRIYWLDGTSALYVSNGTEAGTRMVVSNLSQAGQLYSYKGAAWMQARPTGMLYDAEPWRSDGTAANTAKAFDINPGSASSDPNSYFELNGYLYFFGTNAAGKHLFRYLGDMTFNGSQATMRWRDSANWNSGMPPGINDTAYIPAGLTALVTGNKAYAGTLVLQNTGGIQLAAASDTLQVERAIGGGTITGPGALVLRSTLADTVRVTAALTAGNVHAAGTVSLQAPLTIGANLDLGAGARVLANNSNLTLGGAASTITSGSASSYIVTNGTGSLQIEEIGPAGRTGAVAFPIGTEAFYNPVSISNAGTRDVFRARVQPGVNQSYGGETATGSDYTGNVVNATWMVGEGTTGGSDVTASFQWNAAQELPGFNRTQSQVGHYTGGAWQIGAAGPATGTDPYTRTSGSITSFSPFSIFTGSGALGGTAVSGLTRAANGITMRQQGRELRFDLGRSYAYSQVQLLTTSGQIVGTYSFRQQQQTRLMLPPVSGVYIVALSDGAKTVFSTKVLAP